jgi:hypothetical protein
MNGFRIKGISYDDKYSKEQEEIVKRVKKEVYGKEGNEWYKYKGNITAQIVISHLKNHLPKHLKIVGHNYFIYNSKKEYDAMIVKRNAIDYYNTHKLKDVAAVIEIKLGGFFKKQDIHDLAEEFRKIRCKSALILVKGKDKKEARKMMRNVFAFSNNHWNTENFLGEWQKLVDFIKNL